MELPPVKVRRGRKKVDLEMVERGGEEEKRKTGLFVEQDTKDEIVEILNLDEEENEGLLGGKKNEEKVETVVEFGREDAWWGCCCSDLNRYKLFMKFSQLLIYFQTLAAYVEACKG